MSDGLDLALGIVVGIVGLGGKANVPVCSFKVLCALVSGLAREAGQQIGQAKGDKGEQIVRLTYPSLRKAGQAGEVPQDVVARGAVAAGHGEMVWRG